MNQPLKIRIDTTADLTGGNKTVDVLEEIKKKGDEASASLDNVKLGGDAKVPTIDDILPGFSDLRKRADALIADSKAGTPPPLPGEMGEKFKEAAPALGAAAGVVGFAALAVATRELIANLSEGATRAADMAVELEGMDEASRQAAIAGLGPLGAIISAQSSDLIQYAEDMNEIGRKMDDIWTAAGAQLVPALNEVTGALAKIEASPVGAVIGDLVGGTILYVAQLGEMASALAGSAEAAVSMAGAISRMLPIVKDGAYLLDLLIKNNREFIEQSKEDPSYALKQLEASINRTATAYEALDEARRKASDSNAPLADQLSALVEQQERALANGNVHDTLQLENQIAAVREKIAAEKEAAATKEKQLQAEKSAVELRTRINAAIADGNVEEQRRLEWIQNYSDVYRRTSDDQAAQDSANATLAREIAEEKKRADREAEVSAKQARQDSIQDLQNQYNLQREQGQTAVAELRARGASESELQKSKMEAAERMRAIELEIAEASNKGAEVAAIQEERRKQEAAELTRLQNQEADAAERKAAAEERAAQARHGRESAPLQIGPGGPSNIDQAIDLYNPAKPVGIDTALRLGDLTQPSNPALPNAPIQTGTPVAPNPSSGVPSNGAGGDGGMQAATQAFNDLVAGQKQFSEAVLATAARGIATAQSALAAAQRMEQQLSQMKEALDSLRAGT